MSSLLNSQPPAHDLASDYVEHGVDVTLFQRSETYIMSTKEGMPRVFGGMHLFMLTLPYACSLTSR